MTPNTPAVCPKMTPARPSHRRWAVVAQWLLLLPLLALARPAALRAQPPAAGDRITLPENIRLVAEPGAASESLPAALSRAALTSEEAAASLPVEMILKLRHFAELQRRVDAGETISRAEMAARYLPAEADYQAVARWLTAQGLTVAPGGASHAMVRASGTPNQWQQAFQARFARVTFRGAEYTAAIAAPSLPAEIEARVASVHGLQPYLHPHKSAAIRQSAATAAVSEDIATPYLVSDIQGAYDITASGLTGAGQQIGILIDTVPRSTDLTRFWTANGVGQTLSNIITVNVSGQTLPAPTGEETLDVSWSSGLAPGAQIVVYACGDLDNVNAGYSQVLDDLQSGARPNLHQISMSYGSGELTDETPADMKSVHQLFTAMAAYGVSIFASSGDYGAYGNGGRTVQVLFPASDPNVTGVGGTSLYLNNVTGAVTSETAWSAASTRGASSADGSSGGGISSYFSRPAWQVGGSVPAGSMRLVPDVAFAADPNTGCYLVVNGQVSQYGGTSWGAPSWAALCALVNQARAAAGETALGVANTKLYPLLGTTDFRDVTNGSNGYYDAGVGFDLVTGLGVPDFADLEAALLGNNGTITQPMPAITSAVNATATAGSFFTYQITASNAPTTYAAGGLPAGLSIDPASGLISGTPAAAGTFALTLSATNSAGTGTAALTLTVAPAALPVVALTATVAQVALTGGETGEATLSIAGALSTDLIVYYTVKGSATNGTDYAFLSGHAKIKAGLTSKVVKVRPQGNLDGADRKVVKITLAAEGSYVVGTTVPARIVILNE